MNHKKNGYTTKHNRYTDGLIRELVKHYKLSLKESGDYTFGDIELSFEVTPKFLYLHFKNVDDCRKIIQSLGNKSNQKSYLTTYTYMPNGFVAIQPYQICY